MPEVNMSLVARCVLSLVLVLGVLETVASVGEQKKPTTGGGAAWAVLLTAGLVWLVWLI